MIKRTLKIILLSCLLTMFVLALSACSTSKVTSKIKQAGTKTPYELCTEANNTTNNMMRSSKGISETVRVTVTGPAAGESQSISMAGDTKVNAPDTPLMEVAVNYDLQRAGQDIPMSAYYKGGMSYIQPNGQKLKKKVSMKQFHVSMGITQFPENAIIKQKSAKTSDGTDLDFTLKGETLKGYDSLLNNLRILNMTYGPAVQYDFKDATVTAHIGTDGSLKSCALDVPFSIAVKGKSLTGDLAMKISDITYGHQNITAPSDLSSYKDISSGTGTTAP